MMKSRPQFWSLRSPAVWVLVLFLLLGTSMAGVSQEQSNLTFSEDIAAILYENCVGCHQPNGIGPMPLLSFDDVRPYASRIQRKVETRQMPPWHLDKTIGIQEYKNDISLSDFEIEQIVSWVESGAPEGDPTRLPTLPDLPDGNGWQLAAGPTITYDWAADNNGNRWQVPVGFGVSKTTMIGKIPFKFAVEVQHYLEQPDAFGPEWFVKFKVTPVVQNPFANLFKGISKR